MFWGGGVVKFCLRCELSLKSNRTRPLQADRTPAISRWKVCSGALTSVSLAASKYTMSHSRFIALFLSQPLSKGCNQGLAFKQKFSFIDVFNFFGNLQLTKMNEPIHSAMSSSPFTQRIGFHIVLFNGSCNRFPEPQMHLQFLFYPLQLPASRLPSVWLL